MTRHVVKSSFCPTRALPSIQCRPLRHLQRFDLIFGFVAEHWRFAQIPSCVFTVWSCQLILCTCLITRFDKQNSHAIPRMHTYMDWSNRMYPDCIRTWSVRTRSIWFMRFFLNVYSIPEANEKNSHVWQAKGTRKTLRYAFTVYAQMLRNVFTVFEYWHRNVPIAQEQMLRYVLTVFAQMLRYVRTVWSWHFSFCMCCFMRATKNNPQAGCTFGTTMHSLPVCRRARTSALLVADLVHVPVKQHHQRSFEGSSHD